MCLQDNGRPEDPGWTALDARLRIWAFPGGGREPQQGSEELLRADEVQAGMDGGGRGASRGPRGNSSRREGEDPNRVSGRVSGPRS